MMSAIFRMILRGSRCAVLFLLVVAHLPRVSSNPNTESGGVISAAVRNWDIYLSGFLLFVTVTLQPTYLPFLMEEQGVLSPTTRAVLLAFSTAGSFVGTLAFSQIQGKLPLSTSVGICVVLLTSAFVVFGLWQGQPVVMAAALAAAGFGGGLLTATLFATALARLPGAAGRSVGLLNAAIFGGGFVTPTLLAGPRSSLGISGMTLAIAPFIAVVGAIALMRMARNAKPIVAPAPRHPGSP